jgi:branched-chain amino acid transport system substrate-binding protein
MSPPGDEPEADRSRVKTIFRTVGRDDQWARLSRSTSPRRRSRRSHRRRRDRVRRRPANEVEKTLKAAGIQVVAREKATDKTTDFKAIH